MRWLSTLKAVNVWNSIVWRQRVLSLWGKMVIRSWNIWLALFKNSFVIVSRSKSLNIYSTAWVKFFGKQISQKQIWKFHELKYARFTNYCFTSASLSCQFWTLFFIRVATPPLKTRPTTYVLNTHPVCTHFTKVARQYHNKLIVLFSETVLISMKESPSEHQLAFMLKPNSYILFKVNFNGHVTVFPSSRGHKQLTRYVFLPVFFSAAGNSCHFAI